MFLVWVRTVLQRHVQLAGDVGPAQVAAEQAEHVELAVAELVDETLAAVPERARRRCAAGGSRPRAPRWAWSPRGGVRCGRAQQRRERGQVVDEDADVALGLGPDQRLLERRASPPASSPAAWNARRHSTMRISMALPAASPCLGRGEEALQESDGGFERRRSSSTAAWREDASEGEVLELADVAELVVERRGRRWAAHRSGGGDVAAGELRSRLDGGDGSNRRRDVGVVEQLGLVEQARARHRGRPRPGGGAPSPPASGRRAAGGRRARRARCSSVEVSGALPSRSLRSSSTSLSPTCMSAVPRTTVVVLGERQRRPRRSAAASPRRPCAIWMSASASEQPSTSLMLPGGGEAVDGFDVATCSRRRGRRSVQCGEPDQRGGAAPSEVIRRLRRASSARVA